MSTQEPVNIRCASAEQAAQVVKSLISRHVDPSEIEVISPVPIQEIETLIAGKSRLPAFVLSGAAIGILVGGLLASATAVLYPIDTGGMPIVSLLPVGIVTYEVMMLAAILFCLAGLLLEAKLLRRRPRRAQECTGQAGEDGILVLAPFESSPEVAVRRTNTG